MQNFSKLLFVIFITTFIAAGCKSASVRLGAPVSQSQPTHATSEVGAQDDYTSSAHHYMAMARKNSPPQSHEYELLAAQMFIKAKNYQSANEILEKIPANGLPQDIEQQNL